MPEAWNSEAQKSNEISWDEVFAEDGQEMGELDQGGDGSEERGGSGYASSPPFLSNEDDQ